MILLLCSSLASANPHTATLDDDGFVTLSARLAAPVEAVRGHLDDVTAAFDLVDDARAVRATRRGDCQEIEVETPGILRPMRYISMRCPTADGWSERLVQSEDFALHEVEWHITPAADGATDITYRVRVALSMPGVHSLVIKKLSSSMERTVSRLSAVLPGGPDPD